MTVLLTIIAPLFLLATLVPQAIAQLRHWTPPGRLVLETCSAAVLLIVGSLALPMTGWLVIAWWAVLALCAVGAGVATWRSWTRPAPAVGGLTGRAALNAQPVGTRSLLGHAGIWLIAVLIAIVGG